MAESGTVAPATMTLRTRINGRQVEVEIRPHETLAEVLRDRLFLTGTKVSCDVQVCGACTVLVDGLPVSSCTHLAYEVRDREVLTIEGMSPQDGPLHPIQQAFLDEYAYQCGFCTSGMILTARSLLETNPRATEEDIVTYMDGNICRCTGYRPIVAAIQRVQTTMSESGASRNGQVATAAPAEKE